jgi:hypothetical protein
MKATKPLLKGQNHEMAEQLQNENPPVGSCRGLPSGRISLSATR